MNRLLLTCLFFCAAPCLLSAQTPTHQDCMGAIPLCQNFFVRLEDHWGTGNFQNEISPYHSCIANGEGNSIWYTFSVPQDQLLGFVITPLTSNTKYAWALFDITNAECSEIATNPALLVSCNTTNGPDCNRIQPADGLQHRTAVFPPVERARRAVFACAGPASLYAGRQVGHAFCVQAGSSYYSNGGVHPAAP